MEAVKKKKSKKKLIITLVVIVVVIAGLFAACSAMANKAREQMMAAMSAAETDVVTVRELTKSIGATGKVISARSEDVSTTLAGVEIHEILVEVGDMVEEGQSLLQFDTEDIADNLAIAQRALSQTQGQYSISAQNAQRQVDDAVRSTDYQAQTAYDNMNSAYDTYVSAFDDLEDLEDAEDEAWEAWGDAEEICASVREEMENAGGDTGLELPEMELDEETTAVLEALLDQLNVYLAGATMEDAQSALAQAEAAVSQAEAAYEQARAARENMEDTIDNLYDAYVSAVKSYENIVATGESTVASAQAAQQSTALSVNTDQQQQQIDSLSEQLEKGILTAPLSGVVTAVNYDAGDTYAQGAIMTIQDVSRFEIEAQIGEYDISDIALGQKVLIKTDATREQELEGTVVFVSPTATAVTAMTTTATDPTYEVRIRVDTPSDRLRLDMSASLSIIIDEHENAMTVPYNAVQTAEDGSTFVEVVDGEATTVVPVEVVMESNYYTEIAGDVREGQTVRIVSQETSDMFSVMAEMGGPMGGGGF